MNDTNRVPLENFVYMAHCHRDFRRDGQHLAADYWYADEDSVKIPLLEMPEGWVCGDVVEWRGEQYVIEHGPMFIANCGYVAGIRSGKLVGADRRYLPDSFIANPELRTHDDLAMAILANALELGQ